ncbi:MAG: urease accessory protein UreF [Pseudomonadota bacterium]
MIDPTSGRTAEDDNIAHAEPAFPSELLIWLSPAFPVGSFAYSQGLETAIEHKFVVDPATLATWIMALVDTGSLRTDLQILSLAFRADAARVGEINALALALQPSRERYDETRTQGKAFWQAYAAAWQEKGAAMDTSSPARPGHGAGDDIALPVAVGLAAGRRGLPLAATLDAYGVAAITNLVSAAIRLGVAGQFDGQRVLAQLMGPLRAVCVVARSVCEADIGAATFMADIASLQHETQVTRLFRS